MNMREDFRKRVLDGEFFSDVLGAKWRGGSGVPGEISGATIDSRKILSGEIFIAIKTEIRDGHDFLEAARERGAAGALVSRFVPEIALPQLVVADVLEALRRVARAWRECVSGTVVGVTGSVGKTSTKDLLKKIFSASAPTHATYANLNNTLGVPLTILGARVVENLVVEAGMSVPGELDCSAQMIFPDIALVTNVKPAHLEGLGSMENIAREKSALARCVAENGLAIFPADLLRYEAFRALSCRRIVVSFCAEDFALARDSGAEIVRAEISELADGFSLTLSGCDSAFALPGFSRGLAENSALAVCAARAAGIEEDSVRGSLARWRPSANRGEWRDFPDGSGRKIFVDCYNASPASMLDSVRAFVRRERELGNARNVCAQKLFVLGGMGELGADSGKFHFEVGANLPLDFASDTLALFGGDAEQTGAGAISKGFPRERVFVFGDVERLREFVAAFPGDVMVKGSRAFALERVVP